MVLVVGIDPGFSGAIALLDPTTRQLEVFDMPTLKSTTGKNITDVRALAETLNKANIASRVVSMLERVGSHPSDGKDRVWSFGKHVGHLEMAVAGLGFETYEVTPGQWKKHFRLVADKAASRALAMARFPNNADQFKRVKDDGRAEAALIALYAYETVVGMNQGTKA